jgi:predicted amidophosphoribosyltransferase
VHAVTAWLAGAMVPLVAAPAPSLVTWVPTTPSRRRARGFDHAELLARAVARRLSRPSGGLLRRIEGPPQTGLTGAARRRGPTITARRTVPADVLLVDDVATTGGSLTTAAAALRLSGAVRVVAITAARTPAPRVDSRGSVSSTSGRLRSALPAVRPGLRSDSSGFGR